MPHLCLFQLGPNPASPFPPAELALDEPDGLLAMGGDLSPTRFLTAYRSGIFPWYSEGEPILWWSPNQRAVFRSDGVHVPRRLRRTLRHSGWRVRADTAFAAVVHGCMAPRPGQDGTWITSDMQAAYLELHRLGHAHSIDVFAGDTLVGGVLGLAVGKMFCGDSMFSTHSGASTVALVALASRLQDWGWPCFDAQVPNAHTRRLGVEVWTRADYLHALATAITDPGRIGSWTKAFGEADAATLLRNAREPRKTSFTRPEPPSSISK